METLKAIRKKRKVTQIRLSIAAEVSQETISAYESGKASPSIETLIRMADFLNTSTDYLLGRIKDDNPLSQITNDIVDEQLTTLLYNYAKLNKEQQKDLVWYSSAIEKKEL